MKHFKILSRADALSLTRTRKFETRVGETLQFVADKTDLATSIKDSPAQFILFGIPEDIGIKANHGIGGADSVWTPFLSSFLNIQSNDFFSGEELMLLGYFDFGDIKYLIEQNAYNYDEKIDAYRHAVTIIDEEVEQVSKIITAAGKIPVAVGGGHNNSYPLIKGCSKGLLKLGMIPLAQINCINLDAHSDFRPSEGRHSGNGFRYAEEDGFLEKYCVIGIQENFLPQNVWTDIVNNPFIDLITFEDIFLHGKKDFVDAVEHAIDFTSDNYTGIEIDLDCVSNILSSAETPSGFSTLHARQFLNLAAQKTKTAYLHVCEGAARLADGRSSETTGKLIGYLVSDFIKAALPNDEPWK